MGIKKGYINGVGFGSVMIVLYGSYALAFWYGSSLVRSGEYTAGTLIIVSIYFHLYMYYCVRGSRAEQEMDYNSCPQRKQTENQNCRLLRINPVSQLLW